MPVIKIAFFFADLDRINLSNADSFKTYWRKLTAFDPDRALIAKRPRATKKIFIKFTFNFFFFAGIIIQTES